MAGFIFRTYGCPDCRGTFTVMQARDEDPPRFCTLCGADCGEDNEPVPAKVAIGSPQTRAVDQSVRDIENASIARAEAAGDPGLKITNMNDGLRPGDVAGRPVHNAISQAQAEFAETMGYSPWGGAGISAGSAAGPVAPPLVVNGNAFHSGGHRALKAIQGGGKS